MFFVTYLRRELWRRRKQAVVIALGLAVGIGLVITVTAAAAGVRAAQASVLRSLYGVGTDITVTTKPAVASPGGRTRVTLGPGGSQVCQGGHCHQGATKLDNLVSGAYGPMPAADVASIRGPARGHRGGRGPDPQRHPDQHPRLGGHRGQPAPAAHHQRGRHGSHSSGARPAQHRPDHRGPEPGLLRRARGRGRGGRQLRGREQAEARWHDHDRQDPVQDRRDRQPAAGASPPNVYIPLARAQALARSDQDKKLTGQVNTVYVAASSAAVVPAVAREISRLMPKATVTTSASLASEVTGSCPAPRSWPATWAGGCPSWCWPRP